MQKKKVIGNLAAGSSAAPMEILISRTIEGAASLFCILSQVILLLLTLIVITIANIYIVPYVINVLSILAYLTYMTQ